MPFKAAILARYNVNEDIYIYIYIYIYHQRFRSAVKQRDETYWKLSIRLLDLQNKRLGNYTSVEDMAAVICLEETLRKDVRTWVQNKKPNTCKQAGELADMYVQSRQASNNTPGSSSHNRPFVSQITLFCV